MKNNINNNIILDKCLKCLKSKEFREELKSFLKPILESIFQEISIYIFFIIFFILSSFILHLGVLILLIRYNKKLNN